MDFNKYTFQFDTHRKQKVILISFEFNKQLQEELRKRFPSAKWSKTKKSWYLPDLPVIREKIGLNAKDELVKKLVQIAPVNRQAYQKMYEQLKLKSYSINTRRMYLAEFKHLLLLIKNRKVDDLDPKKLKDYFLYCVEKEKMRERKMNGKINAIKFYFEQVLHRPRMFFDIPRPKKPIVLPKMLSKNQVKSIIDATENLKHAIAIKLCYGLGLRVSEVVNLKLVDIDSSRMVVHIVGAKGKKDRYVPLPDSILPQLRQYCKQYKPIEYLLEGQYGGGLLKK